MPIPVDALAAETRGYRDGSARDLSVAYEILKREWNSGNHDREIGLHLLFVSWYGFVEPTFVTGFADDAAVSEDLRATFSRVHGELKAVLGWDPEFLWVVGLMAHLFPFLIGDEAEWQKISHDYQRRYRQLAPSGIDPTVFSNRGAYGEYFGSQANVKDGY